MTNCNNFRANSLSDLIAKLRQMFESNSVDIDQVKALMASYQSNPAEWIQYTHCDPHRYTRNGVDVGNGKYNLMIVCWPQNITTQVHDHSDSHCIMKVKLFVFILFCFFLTFSIVRTDPYRFAVRGSLSMAKGGRQGEH